MYHETHIFTSYFLSFKIVALSTKNKEFWILSKIFDFKFPALFVLAVDLMNTGCEYPGGYPWLDGRVV
jgi:hypothetical protein